MTVAAAAAGKDKTATVRKPHPPSTGVHIPSRIDSRPTQDGGKAETHGFAIHTSAIFFVGNG
jgi:hypothetical protein